MKKLLIITEQYGELGEKINDEEILREKGNEQWSGAEKQSWKTNCRKILN